MDIEPPINSKLPAELVASSILPIVRAQTWCFAVFNLILAMALYSYHPMRTLIVANGTSSLRVWSITFFLVGAAMIYCLLARLSTALRYVVLAAIFIKITWFVALLLRINYGGTFFFAAAWGLIAALQVVQYMYFFSQTNKPKL